MRDFRAELANASYEITPKGGLHIENAVIFKKNFAGDPSKTKFNSKAKTFCLALPDIIADELSIAGWTIKETRGDDPIPYIGVTMNFESTYPIDVKLWTESKSGRILPITVTDESAHILDEAMLTKVCCDIRPSANMKGYCNKFYATKVPRTSGYSMYEEEPYETDDTPF